MQVVKETDDQDDAGENPRLIGLEKIRQFPVTSSVAGAMILASGLWLANGSSFKLRPAADNSARDNETQQVIRLAASEVPGAVSPTVPKLMNTSRHVFAAFQLSEEDKARVKSELQSNRLRIGAITLWDNAAQDGDFVHLNSAGYNQQVALMNRPKTYFLPYHRGGVVRISGTRDGGGGITLGLGTTFGNINLPTLATGQVIEIGLP